MSHQHEHHDITNVWLRFKQTLRETGVADGWLFYDFRLSDPLAYRVLLLTRHVM